MNIKIGFVGMSHLGLNYAVASAIKGYNVVCYDENRRLIDLLNSKQIPYFEKNLKKNLTKKFNSLEFTINKKKLVSCNLIFISKDVPTNNYGKSNLKIIKKIINSVLKIIKKNTIIVILCQVPPGFTKSIKWDKNNLYYQVETLIYSNAQKRALKPERIIIGKYKNKNISNAYSLYLRKFDCPIIEMDYESAELTKICINIYLISQVTNTNLLSDTAQNIGADWNKITEALKLDKRIGKHCYLKPGLGISGGNLERDLTTLSKFISRSFVYSNYIKNIKNISDYRKNWILRKFNEIIPQIKNLKKIGVLGLAYKEGTNSIKNSPSINFINNIKNKAIKINVFDPKIKNFHSKKRVKNQNNLKDLLKDSQMLIIGTPWKIFKSIDFSNYSNIKKIIDPFNILKKSSISRNKIVTMYKQNEK